MPQKHHIMIHNLTSTVGIAALETIFSQLAILLIELQVIMLRLCILLVLYLGFSFDRYNWQKWHSCVVGTGCNYYKGLLWNV